MGDGQRIGSRSHPLVASVAAINAVTAGFGAVGLMSGWLTLGATVTGRLPWGSSVLGGIALAVVVAVPNALLAAAAIRHDPRCGPLTVAVGILLICWIAGQVVVIREFSFFQPLYGTIGLLMVTIGARIRREGRRRGMVHA